MVSPDAQLVGFDTAEVFALVEDLGLVQVGSPVYRPRQQVDICFRVYNAEFPHRRFCETVNAFAAEKKRDNAAFVRAWSARNKRGYCGSSADSCELRFGLFD